MSSLDENFINQALELSSFERASLAEQLLLSLDLPDTEIDSIWAKEAEARIDAFENGKGDTVSITEVFGKYDKS